MRLLAFYCCLRAAWVLLYLFAMPKPLATAVFLAAGLGMTGDATVSPTAGAVRRDFHLKYFAVILRFLFLGHQCGAFASAWAGGVLLKATGSYAAIWCLDVALCAFAACASIFIPSTRTRA